MRLGLPKRRMVQYEVNSVAMLSLLVFTSLLMDSSQKSQYFQVTMRNVTVHDDNLEADDNLKRLEESFVAGNNSDVISIPGIYNPGR